jgi:hypothetical protein
MRLQPGRRRISADHLQDPETALCDGPLSGAAVQFVFGLPSSASLAVIHGSPCVPETSHQAARPRGPTAIGGERL